MYGITSTLHIQIDGLKTIHIIRNVNVTSRTGHVKSNHNTTHILRQCCRRHQKMSSLSKNAEIFKEETCHDCSFAGRGRGRERKKTKRMWVREMQREDDVGEYHTLYRQLEDDESSFYKYFRISKQQFYSLQHKIEVHIQKQNTIFREAISTKEKLMIVKVVLHYPLLR